jgi:hypothetical protein
MHNTIGRVTPPQLHLYVFGEGEKKKNSTDLKTPAHQ